MDKRQFTRLIAILLWLQTGMAVAETRLPELLMVKETQLQQCSQGPLTVFGFISVGAAAVYLVTCDQLPLFFSNQPKMLRFSYQRAIPGDAFRKAADFFLEKNLGSQYLKWQEQIKQFNTHYQSVDAGDYYDLLFFPEQGLSLKLNTVELAKISDAELGLAYFKIWLGNEPFSEDLKQALLTPHQSAKADDR